MRKILVALSLLLPVFTAPAADQALWEKSTLNQVIRRGELRVGMEAGYLPFEMRDKKGDIIGFDVDLAKLMARAMGVKVTFVNTAWDGIIPALLTDKFDILMGGMTITPERNLQVNFAQPYIVIGQTLLVAKKSADRIHGIKDANDPQFTIGTKLGTTGDIAAKRYAPKAKIKTYESQTDAALEVRSGRIDAMIYDLPFNAIYGLQNKDTLVHLKEPFTKEPLGWAVRKGDPDFLNWLDHFLNQIRNDGSYDALYSKWFESTAWMVNINGQ
ncbi:MAG: transporter substrate-binding domain-containing protein [Nevskia sp.]